MLGWSGEVWGRSQDKTKGDKDVPSSMPSGEAGFVVLRSASSTFLHEPNTTRVVIRSCGGWCGEPGRFRDR